MLRHEFLPTRMHSTSQSTRMIESVAIATALASHSRPCLLERPFRRRAIAAPASNFVSGAQRDRSPPGRSGYYTRSSVNLQDKSNSTASSKPREGIQRETAKLDDEDPLRRHTAEFPSNMLLACFSVVPSLILPQSRALRTPAAAHRAL